MELDKKHIEQLRMAELDLLRVFMSVCDELGLQYFIVQGTLLGAVRHGGFIPWDDDIDVGMLRKDYDILMSKGQTLLPPGYFLQTHENDPGYIHGFGKLRNSNTAFVETTCRYRKMNHGIFIDIFPFDFYPDSRLKRCAFELKKFFLRYRVQDLLNMQIPPKMVYAWTKAALSTTMLTALSLVWVCFTIKLQQPTIMPA